MKKSTPMGRKVLVAALLASAGASLPQVAIAQQADETTASNTEIIVTAQRREEKAQDVPIMITAVSAEGLRERAVTDLQGMQNQVPSLIVAPNGQSSRDVMSPSIRGQGTSFQGSPGVVVYMNEIPLVPAATLSSQGGPGNFVDLQSVQVLSGAQGTLFGRNTTGGAILLTAARPTDKLEGSISGGIGNYNMTELEAVVNVPLTDKLAVRLVGATRDRDGFTKDITWNKDRDDTHWRMGRIGIQWNPTDTISSYTMASYGYSKNNGTGVVPESFNTSGLTRNGSCGGASGVLCSAYTDLITKQQGLGIRTVAHGIDSFSKLEAWTVMNSTDVELTDNLKIRNIASYSTLKYYYANEMDGTIANSYNTGNTRFSHLNPKDNFQQFTEELQFQGEALDKNLTYTAGIFYSHQSPNGPNIDYATTNGRGFTEHASEQYAAFRDVALTNETTALFAQATLDLGALTPALEKVRLTGGFRHNWDKVSGTAVTYKYFLNEGSDALNPGLVKCSFNGAEIPAANAFNPINSTTPANGGCKFSSNTSDTASTWTIGLDYQPIDDLLLYAKVSRGYKVGGFNSYAVNPENASFGPELMTDYEFGFKSDFEVAGRETRLNVNGFNMDYSNIQRGLPDISAVSPTTTGAVIRNVPSARIRGVEIEAMVKPVDGLEIGGNYSYIDAKYKTYTFSNPFPQADCKTSTNYAAPKQMDLTCIPLQYLAPNIFSVYGRLQLPVPESVGNVSLFASYAWSDKQHTAPGALEKTVDTGAVWEPGVTLPSYGLLSATLNWNNFLQSGLDLSLFGTNLTNKIYKISNSGTYGSQNSQSVIYGEPRMYGLRLKYKFGN